MRRSAGTYLEKEIPPDLLISCKETRSCERYTAGGAGRRRRRETRKLATAQTM